MAMPSAEQVAHRFVQLAAQEGRGITQLELHKLVYAAHGWHLAIRGKGLVSEAPEAWKYGPVYASLRRELREFGARPISDWDWRELGLDTEELDRKSRSIVDQTWEQYKDVSAGDLIDLTHMDGTPWSETYDPTTYNKPIRHAVIEKHFAAKLKDPEGVSGL